MFVTLELCHLSTDWDDSFTGVKEIILKCSYIKFILAAFSEKLK